MRQISNQRRFIIALYNNNNNNSTLLKKQNFQSNKIFYNLSSSLIYFLKNLLPNVRKENSKKCQLVVVELEGKLETTIFKIVGRKKEGRRARKIRISSNFHTHRWYLPLISTFTSRLNKRSPSSSTAWIFIPFPECIEFQTKSARNGQWTRMYDYASIFLRIKRMPCLASQTLSTPR